jgi:hypothetical protein
MSKSSDKVANTLQSFINQMNPGDMYMTHRQSSVKVFPNHLNTEPKKYYKVPLNCRDSERLDGLIHGQTLEKIIQTGSGDDNLTF